MVHGRINEISVVIQTVQLLCAERRGLTHFYRKFNVSGDARVLVVLQNVLCCTINDDRVGTCPLFPKVLDSFPIATSSCIFT